MADDVGEDVGDALQEHRFVLGEAMRSLRIGGEHAVGPVLPFDGRAEGAYAAVVADLGRPRGARIDLDGDGAAVRAEHVADHVHGRGQQHRQIARLEGEHAEASHGFLLAQAPLHFVLGEPSLGDVDPGGQHLGDGARRVAERDEDHVEVAAGAGRDLDVELAPDQFASGRAADHLQGARRRDRGVRHPRRLVDAPANRIGPGHATGEQRGLVDVQHDAVGRVDGDQRHQAVDDVSQASLAAGGDHTFAALQLADHAGEEALAAGGERGEGELAEERAAVPAAAFDPLRRAEETGLAGGQVAAELGVVLAAVGERNQESDILADARPRPYVRTGAQPPCCRP